jgi:hypothetical protein
MANVQLGTFTSSNIPDNNLMNEKLYNRNVPSEPLQPYLDVRPTGVRFSVFPIINLRPKANVPIRNLPVFNQGQNFNPGNTNGPWSGYASNVNTESILKNQIYALQCNSKAVYVPSSKSDLYNNYNVPHEPEFQNPENQIFPKLFHQETFNEFNPNNHDLGYEIFNNSTRTQLKNLPNPVQNPSFASSNTNSQTLVSSSNFTTMGVAMAPSNRPSNTSSQFRSNQIVHPQQPKLQPISKQLRSQYGV